MQIKEYSIFSGQNVQNAEYLFDGSKFKASYSTEGETADLLPLYFFLMKSCDVYFSSALDNKWAMIFFKTEK